MCVVQRVATLEFEFAAATAEPAVSTSSDSSSSSAFVTRRAYEELLATAEAQTADLRHRCVDTYMQALRAYYFNVVCMVLCCVMQYILTLHTILTYIWWC